MSVYIFIYDLDVNEKRIIAFDFNYQNYKQTKLKQCENLLKITTEEKNTYKLIYNVSSLR